MLSKVLLCGIGKLENNYIKEWVEYHKKLGFNNIVLYDNNDIDGEHFEDVIGNHINSGYVILKNWRGRELAQIPSYNDCYKEYQDKYDWICYWDIDEFIEFDKCKTIQEFLSQKKFEKAKCIRICWKQYTDNGLLGVKDNNYSVKRFTEVFDKEYCHRNKISIQRYYVANTQAKSIIRTGIKNFKVDSPHCFLKVPTVNAMGNKCEIGIKLGNIPVWSGAWLNHYRFKTIEEYVTKKMVRLWPTTYMNGGKDRLDLDYFFMFNKKTHEKVKYAKDLSNSIDKNSICINSWTTRDKNGALINKNWGDELNYYFLGNIFAKKIVPYMNTNNENYTMIGSIIGDKYINENTVIWGAGIQLTDKKLHNKPAKVCAVRGPLTRKYLIENGIECPEVYGDPSLLLPYYYYPIVEKKYEIGFIPHWSSLDSPQTKIFARNKNVHLIRLKDYNNWLSVIDEILSCKYIISESLHGLIMAEAYNIPNLWVDITLKHIYDVKYHDFFLSIGKDRNKPIKLNDKFSVKDALAHLKKYKKGESKIDLVKLVESCPVEIKNKAFLDRVKNNTIVKINKIKMNNKYDDGISVCITAYKAKKYIKETLDSIAQQTWFKTHNNWEIIVGVDGCEETLDYLRTIMDDYRNLRIYMMDSNQGTYITTNTIMSLARYSGLIRFDSDDIMLPEMVETIMKEKGDADFVTFMMQNFGRRSGKQIAGGQIWVKHSIFDKFGGYMPWSCSADTEFEMRLKKFVKTKRINKVLFKRRIHSTNLTVAKDTNFSSLVRKKNLKYCNTVTLKIKNEKDAIIKMKVNTYYEVFSDDLSDSGITEYNFSDSGQCYEEDVIVAEENVAEKIERLKKQQKEIKNKTKEIIEKQKNNNNVVKKEIKIKRSGLRSDPRFDTGGW